MSDFTRREFFKVSTAAMGALSLGCSKFGKKTGGATGIKRSYCDMCYWHCGIKVEVENGKVVELEDAGHSLYITHADQTETSMRGFLDSLED